MWKILKLVLLQIRAFFECFVEFCFSLYWERKRVPVPDLDRQFKFLSDSATTLAGKIRHKKLSSEQVTRAFIQRIKEVNPILNAVVKDRFEEALAEAKEIDTAITRGLSDEEFDKKPFLGVPFTTKECQGIKGMSLTIGVWSRRHEVSSEDSGAVVKLRAAGAIPLATTNIPEMLLWTESRNTVYGMTVNPHHTGRTSGGSSGGEAALMASFGTPISLGSDIGGSVRIPAFYCGVSGYLPTAETTDVSGSFLRKGDESPTMANLGFLSRHVEDLGPLTKIIAGEKAPMLNLDRDVNIQNVQFYYTESSEDPLVSQIQPDIRNAMRRVISKLKREVSTANSPQPYYHPGFNSMFWLWDYMITKEPEDVELLFNNNGIRANVFIELGKKLLGLSYHTLSSVFFLLKLNFFPTPSPAWAEKLITEFKKDLCTKLGDNGVLLMPSGPTPAPYNYETFFKPFNFSYWGVVNALKCPSVQVPIGINRQGLPIGIQVVSTPYNDALCLAVAKYLEKEFGGSIKPCKFRY